jgi:hypothetical protein
MSGTLQPGSATDYLETALLQHSLAIVAMAFPAAVYLAVTTTEPTDADAGSAPAAGGGYVRRLVTFALAAGRTDLAVNAATVEWLPATADWGVVGWFEVWSAVTGGNRLYWGPMVDPVDLVTPVTRLIEAGDILRVPIGAIAILAD